MPQTLGERIAQARREMGVREHRDVTQRDIATALKVSGASVSEWESGKVIPREDALTKLAKFLGVTPAYLRYGVQPGDFREGHGEIVAGRGAPIKKVPKKQA